jgi:hypothetical protein
MTMWKPLFGLAAIAAAHSSCVHDQIMANLAEVVPHEERHLQTSVEQNYDIQIDAHGRVLQSTFNSIRIRINTTLLEDGA